MPSGHAKRRTSHVDVSVETYSRVSLLQEVLLQTPMQSFPDLGSQSSRRSSTHTYPVAHCNPANPPHDCRKSNSTVPIDSSSVSVVVPAHAQSESAKTIAEIPRAMIPNFMMTSSPPAACRWLPNVFVGRVAPLAKLVPTMKRRQNAANLQMDARRTVRHAAAYASHCGIPQPFAGAAGMRSPNPLT